MSRPGYNYDGFCLEEHEGYVADYSESEMLSDRPQRMLPDVTELYHAVPQPVQMQMDPRYGHFVPGEYYYEGGGYGRRSRPVFYDPRVVQCYRGFEGGGGMGMGGGTVGGFRSSSLLESRREMFTERGVGGMEKIRPSRRYPVTVRTPRYYRRPTHGSLYKRPSALCLPVACKPEPRRSKKSGQESRRKDLKGTVGYLEPVKDCHRRDKLGIGSLEEILARFEKEVEDQPLEELHKPDLAKIVKSMKPKGGVKEVKEEVESGKEKEGRDPLEKLLNQLKKCEGGKEGVERVEEIEGKKGEGEPERSFNYKDVSEHLSRAQAEGEDKVNVIGLDLGNICGGCNLKPYNVPALDDNCALELHRSKSYIVNLIDRALSKELGTIPCEKCARKEFESMSPKKAIELMNRHGGLREKELSMEFTSGLGDSFGSNTTGQDNARQCDSKMSSKGGCSGCSEEPLYIKQLKQLRWGHLKHIQREVKRLEDLEKFLDSCTNSHSDL